VVITAAHCIFEGNLKPGPFYFTPAFAYDKASGTRIEPHGTFRVDRAYVPQEWTSRGDSGYDFAFLAMARNDHGRLGDVVGGLGLDFNPSLLGTVTAIGYPGCDPSGRKQCPGQQSCIGDYVPWPLNANQVDLVNCKLAQGASGGPWLRDFNPSSPDVTGVVVGVNSQSATGCKLFCPGILSPHFGGAAESLYHQADSSVG
jgi:hypothetical protein